MYVIKSCVGTSEEEAQQAMLKGLASRLGIMGELLNFLWRRKYWWLVPMISVLLIFGLLMIFMQSSALAPFIYPLF